MQKDNSNLGEKRNTTDLGGIYKEDLGKEDKRDKIFLSNLTFGAILGNFVFVIEL